MPEHGPFSSEREALATQAAAVINAAYDRPYGRDGEEWRSVIHAAKLKVLTDACEAAGVILSEYELGLFRWLTNWETSTVVLLAGIIGRASEDGKRAAAEGTVTQWGLRLTGESGEPIEDAYPGEQAARDAVPRFQGVFDTVVVSRQVTPWTVAPSSCRHCGQLIEPCATPHDYPVCKGWRHVGYDSQPVIGHCCEGRSINPPAEPADATAKEGDGDAAR